MKTNKQIKPYPQPENIPVIPEGYMLTENFHYIWWSPKAKRFFKIVTPTGFRYDGASIPRILWSVTGMSKDGIHRAAATVHDFLYKNTGAIGTRMFISHKVTERWMVFPSTVNRKQVDILFYQMLKEAGISQFKAKGMYFVVRVFGGKAWEK